MPDILPYKTADTSRSLEQDRDDVSFLRLASGFGVAMSVIALAVVVYVFAGVMKYSEVTIAIILVPAVLFCSTGILQGMLTLSSNPRQRKLGLLVLLVNLLPFAISGFLMTIFFLLK